VQSQQQYQMAQPQHQPPPQPNGLEAIFAQFSGNQPAAPQPAAPQPVANPQLAMFDPAIQAALATLKLQNPVQQGYMAPAPAQAATPDLQALLSRLGPQPSAPPQNYNYQGSYQNDGDRKRPYDYDDQRQNERYSDGKRVRGNLGKKVGLRDSSAHHNMMLTFSSSTAFQAFHANSGMKESARRATNVPSCMSRGHRSSAYNSVHTVHMVHSGHSLLKYLGHL